MDCTGIRQEDLPNTTRLFADLAYHPERLEAFYPHTRRDMASYQESARAVTLSDVNRAALVDALGPLNPGSAALEQLARPGTLAVVTGQQVGLFSGPAYTIYKALTAAKLARELSAHGIPAVPVFWLATEDHDFAEVNHCWVFDAQHRPVKLEMPRAAAPGQPVGQVVLEEPPLAGLLEAICEFPFGSALGTALATAYAPGRTMGQAFSALLKELLAPYDLVHVDPLLPAVRELAAPAIRAALDAADELTAAVLERNARLHGAGYHAQVHVEEHTSFVFLLENGRRLPLRRHGREYVLDGRRFTTAELMDRAAALSPNALLRPLVQDSILPTVAYVGGPAELAYLAQSEVLYRRLLGRMPVPVPRASFTLLDQHSRKLIERYGVCLEDFFHGPDVLRDRMAVKLIPPALAGVLAETRGAVEEAVGRLSGELAGFDPTLAAAVDKSRHKMLYQISKSERKIGREMLARHERAARDAVWLYGLIYPQRHLQERLYTILPFLARHGPDLPERLFESLLLDSPDHQIRVF
jgi:bacillithiol biosynthesis cysteine-adding enzyme BshC